MRTTNKLIKRFLWILLVVFILMNTVAYFHAYKFTHFGDALATKTKEAEHLSFVQKISALFFGVNNPRPETKDFPKRPFETIKLKSNKEIECWFIKADRSKGTVILCHGFSAQKASMLDHAELFLNSGYNTLLIDFMGSGGSEGNQTTVGYFEAGEVKTTCDYLENQGEKNILLFGTSMGAVAIMKAQAEYKLNVQGIIIECPFGTLLETVQARFKTMHVPAFPMANFLVFWGGVQNNFNAFKHNPTEYAKAITCPTLLLYGGADEKVSRKEIDDIFRNLRGTKNLKIYPLAGHENYLEKYKNDWVKDVNEFMEFTKHN